MIIESCVIFVKENFLKIELKNIYKPACKLAKIDLLIILYRNEFFLHFGFF